MKIKRFVSVFLLCACITALFLTPAASAQEAPELHSKAALLMDANTGAVVYAKNEHDELYPASLTKIMTALLTLDAIKAGKLSMDQELTATATALEGLSEDGSSAGIKVGETMTVRNLMYCMLVVSANEACDILGEAVAGSVSAFVDVMNAKAQELGCEDTHFANPNGLHDPQHYTSAWDMYLITKAALEYPDFLTICDTGTYTVPATNLSPARTLHTTNFLIDTWRSRGYRNKDAHGIKTGSTDAAGHCLVSSATRGSLHFISVVLGGDRVTLEDGEIRTYSFYDTNLLFNWAFDNFAYRTILEGKEIIQEVPVSLSKTDYVTVHPADDVEVLFPKDLNPEDLERVITLPEDQEAPITAGQKLGTMELKDGDTSYATVDLLASNDVEADKLMVFRHNVTLFFQKPAVRTGIVVVLVLIVLLLVLYFTRGSRRRRYGRSYHSYSSGYRGRHRR